MSAELKQISNETAEHDYVDALTIYNPDATFTAVFVQIYNAAVWYSIAAGPGADFGSDTFLGPVVGTIALPSCHGIRFKFVDPAAAEQAQVSATMLTDSEAPNAVTSLAPTMAIVNPAGAIVAGAAVVTAVQGSSGGPTAPWAVRISNGAAFVDTIPADVVDRAARLIGKASLTGSGGDVTTEAISGKVAVDVNVIQTVAAGGGSIHIGTVDQGNAGSQAWLADVVDRAARLLGHVTVDSMPQTDFSDRAARLVGHVTVDTMPAVDVTDRAARLVGHVTVDTMPSVTADISDRAARLLGHVTVDSMPQADVSDRSGRLLGHVSVDTLPNMTLGIDAVGLAKDATVTGVAKDATLNSIFGTPTSDAPGAYTVLDQLVRLRKCVDSVKAATLQLVALQTPPPKPRTYTTLLHGR